VSAPTEASENDASGDSITRDDCFDLLSNHRRRYALHYLQQNGDGATLGELADHVAAWENDVDTDVVTHDQRKRVYTSLQQVHLPRMDEMNVVEFDDRQGHVTIGPAAEDLDIYLEIVQDDDVSWSTFYFGLVLVNGGLLTGAILGVPLLASIPGIGWAVFAVTTFLVTSLAHLYLAQTEMRLGETEVPPEMDS
jgi:hypothetical protein